MQPPAAPSSEKGSVSFDASRFLARLRGGIGTKRGTSDVPERPILREQWQAAWATLQVACIYFIMSFGVVFSSFRYRVSDDECTEIVDPRWNGVLAFVDVCLVLDVIVHFFDDFEPYYRDEQRSTLLLLVLSVVKDPEKIPGENSRRCLSYLTGHFVLDAFTALPVSWWFLGDNLSACDPALCVLWTLHVLRFLRLAGLFSVIRRTQPPKFIPTIFKRIHALWNLALSLHRDLFRIGMLAVVVFFIFHLIACTVWIVKSENQETLEIWRENQFIGGDNVALRSRYLRCLFLTVATTLGYGAMLEPVTDLETAHSVVCLCIGVVVFATIVTNILAAWESHNSFNNERQSKLNLLTRYMDERSVSPALKNRILEYYEYIFSQRYISYEKAIFEELPLNLRRDLALEMFAEIIQRVELFHHEMATQDFIAAIVLQLKPLSALPGDHVIDQGQMGEDMFIIKSGRVEVFVNEEFICFKGEGDYFGEIACISPQKRTATVIAKEYTQLFSLSKDSLDELLHNFPSMRDVLEERAAGNIQDRARRLEGVDSGTSATVVDGDHAEREGSQAASVPPDVDGEGEETPKRSASFRASQSFLGPPRQAVGEGDGEAMFWGVVAEDSRQPDNMVIVEQGSDVLDNRELGQVGLGDVVVQPQASERELLTLLYRGDRPMHMHRPSPPSDNAKADMKPGHSIMTPWGRQYRY